jgi:isopentenyldiphosphate isomerase
LRKKIILSDGNEILEVVDKYGNVLKLAKRSEIHRNPSLIHRVVHVLVFDKKGRLLLQKRSLNKDVAPGKWDTSVGGHVNPGEDILEAAKREMKEELVYFRLDYCMFTCFRMILNQNWSVPFPVYIKSMSIA